jgi:hypothetical protein
MRRHLVHRCGCVVYSKGWWSRARMVHQKRECSTVGRERPPSGRVIAGKDIANTTCAAHNNKGRERKTVRGVVGDGVGGESAEASLRGHAFATNRTKGASSRVVTGRSRRRGGGTGGNVHPVTSQGALSPATQAHARIAHPMRHRGRRVHQRCRAQRVAGRGQQSCPAQQLHGHHDTKETSRSGL